MRQADQPRDGSWRPNSSPHWAEAERRGEEGSGGGEKRGRARTEEAELAGVDLDEHVLAAHRGRRRPGRASGSGRTGRRRSSGLGGGGWGLRAGGLALVRRACLGEKGWTRADWDATPSLRGERVAWPFRDFGAAKRSAVRSSASGAAGQSVQGFVGEGRKDVTIGYQIVGY